MSNAKTDYLENELLDHVLNNLAYTPPSAIYVGLFTTMPNDDGTGGVEVTGGSYARESVVFSVASAGQVANNGAVTFTQATALWGTVLGMGLFDALTSGNLLYYGTLAAPKTVDNGDTISFANAAMTVSET